MKRTTRPLEGRELAEKPGGGQSKGLMISTAIGRIVGSNDEATRLRWAKVVELIGMTQGIR